MSKPDDGLGRYRRDPGLRPVSVGRLPKAQLQRSWFLKGPIPGAWLQIASRLPGRSLHVALAIWFQSGLTKSREVRITTRTRELFSLPPDAYHRGLKQLELARLVDVRRAPGRCALVTLLEPPDESEIQAGN